MHLFMLLFTSLYFSDLLGSNRLFLSSPLLSHRSRISAVTQGSFLLTMFAEDRTGCFSHCCVEGGDHWIFVCIFVAHDAERCRLPAHHSLEGFQHVGIFQFFQVSGEGGRSLSASHDHFQCLLLENFVFWQCSLLIGSASSCLLYTSDAADE